MSGKRDPGYGSTCRMVAEAALCLASGEDQVWTKAGGVVPPSVALGMPYVERLNKAGITFEVRLPEAPRL